jgi:hypothetical protein
MRVDLSISRNADRGDGYPRGSLVGDIPANTGDVITDGLYGLIEFLLTAARDEDIRTLLGE